VNAPLLKSLGQVRERREEISLRALEAASRAVAEAQRKLDECRAAQQAIEHEIVETRQRPYRSGAASMGAVQLSQQRVDLLKERLAQAIEQVRIAQADLTEKQALRAQALQAHLLARAKREAVQDQWGRAVRAERSHAERGQIEAAQELAIVRAFHGSPNGSTH
jgi:hypothetical protein